VTGSNTRWVASESVAGVIIDCMPDSTFSHRSIGSVEKVERAERVGG
jgi:hypothetical protein